MNRLQLGTSVPGFKLYSKQITWYSIEKGGNATLMPLVFQHIVPSNALSISFCVGKGLFLRRAYMDITIPGVQNPHWEPWDFAIRSYTRERQAF